MRCHNHENPVRLASDRGLPELSVAQRAPFCDLSREALKKLDAISGLSIYTTYREVRYLGLSESAAEKLGRFLLDLRGERNETG